MYDYHAICARVQEYCVRKEVSIPRWRSSGDAERFAFRANVLRAIRESGIPVDEQDLQVVRDVYIAESLYRDATPQVSFVLPGPHTSLRIPREDGTRHYSEVDLARSIEHRPGGPQAYEIPGVVNHSAEIGRASCRERV